MVWRSQFPPLSLILFGLKSRVLSSYYSITYYLNQHEFHYGAWLGIASCPFLKNQNFENFNETDEFFNFFDSKNQFSNPVSLPLTDFLRVLCFPEYASSNSSLFHQGFSFEALFSDDSSLSKDYSHSFGKYSSEDLTKLRKLVNGAYDKNNRVALVQSINKCFPNLEKSNILIWNSLFKESSAEEKYNSEIALDRIPTPSEDMSSFFSSKENFHAQSLISGASVDLQVFTISSIKKEIRARSHIFDKIFQFPQGYKNAEYQKDTGFGETNNAMNDQNNRVFQPLSIDSAESSWLHPYISQICRLSPFFFYQILISFEMNDVDAFFCLRHWLDSNPSFPLELKIAGIENKKNLVMHQSDLLYRKGLVKESDSRPPQFCRDLTSPISFNPNIAIHRKIIPTKISNLYGDLQLKSKNTLGFHENPKIMTPLFLTISRLIGRLGFNHPHCKEFSNQFINLHLSTFCLLYDGAENWEDWIRLYAIGIVLGVLERNIKKSHEKIQILQEIVLNETKKIIQGSISLPAFPNSSYQVIHRIITQIFSIIWIAVLNHDYLHKIKMPSPTSFELLGYVQTLLTRHYPHIFGNSSQTVGNIFALFVMSFCKPVGGIFLGKAETLSIWRLMSNFSPPHNSDSPVFFSAASSSTFSSLMEERCCYRDSITKDFMPQTSSSQNENINDLFLCHEPSHQIEKMFNSTTGKRLTSTLLQIANPNKWFTLSPSSPALSPYDSLRVLNEVAFSSFILHYIPYLITLSALDEKTFCKWKSYINLLRKHGLSSYNVGSLDRLLNCQQQRWTLLTPKTTFQNSLKFSLENDKMDRSIQQTGDPQLPSLSDSNIFILIKLLDVYANIGETCGLPSIVSELIPQTSNAISNYLSKMVITSILKGGMNAFQELIRSGNLPQKFIPSASLNPGLPKEENYALSPCDSAEQLEDFCKPSSQVHDSVDFSSQNAYFKSDDIVTILEHFHNHMTPERFLSFLLWRGKDYLHTKAVQELMKCDFDIKQLPFLHLIRALHRAQEKSSQPKHYSNFSWGMFARESIAWFYLRHSGVLSLVQQNLPAIEGLTQSSNQSGFDANAKRISFRNDSNNEINHQFPEGLAAELALQSVFSIDPINSSQSNSSLISRNSKSIPSVPSNFEDFLRRREQTEDIFLSYFLSLYRSLLSNTEHGKFFFKTSHELLVLLPIYPSYFYLAHRRSYLERWLRTPCGYLYASLIDILHMIFVEGSMPELQSLVRQYNSHNSDLSVELISQEDNLELSPLLKDILQQRSRVLLSLRLLCTPCGESIHVPIRFSTINSLSEILLGVFPDIEIYLVLNGVFSTNPNLRESYDNLMASPLLLAMVSRFVYHGFSPSRISQVARKIETLSLTSSHYSLKKLNMDSIQCCGTHSAVKKSLADFPSDEIYKDFLLFSFFFTLQKTNLPLSFIGKNRELYELYCLIKHRDEAESLKGKFSNNSLVMPLIQHRFLGTIGNIQFSDTKSLSNDGGRGLCDALSKRFTSRLETARGWHARQNDQFSTLPIDAVSSDPMVSRALPFLWRWKEFHLRDNLNIFKVKESNNLDLDSPMKVDSYIFSNDSKSLIDSYGMYISNKTLDNFIY